MKTKKLLVISGPTAVGKTRLALQLARKLKGEIVSADSRQVYRGMDIGTGKGISNLKFQIDFKFQISNFKFEVGYYEIDGVKIWMMDVVEPDYRFNVADYKKCADVVIKDIWKRGKLPIVVGGTGFYIKAVTDGIGTIDIKLDWELRNKLSNCQIDELQIMLKDLDPERGRRMNESDRQNPRRLIRAIEIAQNSNYQLTNSKEISNFPAIKRDPAAGGDKFQISNFDVMFIGLTAPNEILYRMIDQRVDERVKNGLEDEIKSLLTKGYNWENSALGTTIAYKEWKNYFDENVGAQRVAPVQRWKFDEHDYAGRQMTWFKKDKRINWFDITKKDYTQGVEKLVESWYI